MPFLTLLILALQQGVPGQTTTTGDGSAAGATFLFIGIALVLVITGIVLAVKYVSGRRNRIP
jgi:hypothetical protein